MNKKDALLIKIDAYLRGYLPNAEKKALEQQMATDADLAKRVEQQRRHLDALELLLEDDLKTKMQNWEADIEKEKYQKKGKFFGGALFILIILGAFYVFSLKPKKQTGLPQVQDIRTIDSLNLEKKEPQKPVIDSILNKTIRTKPGTKPIKKLDNTPQNPLQPLVENTNWIKDFLDSSKNDLITGVSEMEKEVTNRGEQSDTLIIQTYSLIQTKNYNKAINLLENKQNISNPDASGTEGGYLLAITYFLNNQYEKALPLFDVLAQDKGFFQAETAEYYATLCTLVHKNNVKTSQRLLKMANDKGHPFSEKAKIILKQLGY